MKQDIHYETCKECGESKQKIRFNKYPSKDPKWVDETGRLWNGSICSVCHRKKQAELMRQRRLKKKLEQTGKEDNSDNNVG